MFMTQLISLGKTIVYINYLMRLQSIFIIVSRIRRINIVVIAGQTAISELLLLLFIMNGIKICIYVPGSEYDT